ncbi:CST complex subunit STN1 [Amaranthus tricolor]|uniref:CST complex subunit STN1 n=1 Tax=Amaranthus tricolor TaxID=29722 RepID=UPI00258EA892|nr:CST complex subunit STN1 [Amaranthus tricolor]XP_057517527.1 CST complex subunit STN1 [Amaranthus tricolor]
MSNQKTSDNKNTTTSIDPIRLHNINVKLLAFDFNSLTKSHSFSTSSSSNPIIFSRKGIPISLVEVFGIVVTRELKPDKFLRFSIDDGTGCVQCILWLNQLTSPYFFRRRTPDVHAIAQMASIHCSRVQIGFSCRVRGRVSSFHGLLQITVDDVVVERDPNYDVLHWLDCINLARKLYNAMPSCKR